MPTYAYVCKDCAHAFDAQQSFSDDALTTCPECGGVLRKQFGAVGVVFKGSGFYKTDSRDSGKKPAASSSSSSSAAKESSTKASGKDTSTTTKSSDSTASASSATSSSNSSSDGSAA